MLRRSHILTTAALLAVFAVPASAATYEDLTDPAPAPSSIATPAADEYQDLRSPDAKDAAAQRGVYESESGPYVLDRDYGSPDAADAGRDLPSVADVTHSNPGPYTDAERNLVESPEVQQVQQRLAGVIAADAGRDLPSVADVTHSNPGPYTDAERKLVESPEVQQMVDRLAGEISASSPVVAVSAPSGGFDWGDAGIGAAGMVALFSIAAGSALLLMGRRRRRDVRVAH